MMGDTTNIVRRLFGMRKEYSVSFYITDFLFRKLFRQNAAVKYPIHFTSTIHNAKKLKVGKETFPGDSPNVYINAQNGVTIGDYSNLGPAVGIISANHDFVDNSQAADAPPIEIGRYCWMGMGAIILPGVRLGDFTIVGAGAVVTKSFPDGFCVIAGNPAKVIKELNKAECEAFADSKE
ncbi:MAG: acyltransferase [Chitinophagales bacterium]|nr:acyltransferase [Chitinophagaceae bacterium]MCB9065680.1 acyltransferase [Chitinophagales bacterium]